MQYIFSQEGPREIRFHRQGDQPMIQATDEKDYHATKWSTKENNTKARRLKKI